MIEPQHTLQHVFIRQSCNRLLHDYLPKIECCLQAVSHEQIWWRPNSASNSIGNICLHVAGNLRQWMVHGLGGAVDERQRDSEFATDSSLDGDQLKELLARTIDSALTVIRGLSSDDLLTKGKIQGYEITGLSAVYHVVEHFAGHTGQIIWIAKSLTGKNLKFYDL